jgi:hypothetical protein
MPSMEREEKEKYILITFVEKLGKYFKPQYFHMIFS